MTRHTTLLLCAIVVTLIAIRCRRCPDLSAHEDCWQPWRDCYVDRLGAEAAMLRGVGR